MASNLLSVAVYYSFVGVWAFSLFKVLLRWLSPLGQLPYPPGPPERSLISGNAADIPATESWLTYVEFAKKYGSIIHLRAYGGHIIVLHSYDAAIEFFEKRSNIYSDRPHLTSVDMMGWGFNAGLMRYGSKWRSHRRIYQEAFKPETSLNYHPIQTKKVKDFLYSLLNTPEDFFDHYRTLPGAIVLSAIYDLDVAPKNDLFVDLAKEAVARLGYGLLPGATLVNTFPILRFIPSWFPGAEFHRFAIETRKVATRMKDLPLASVEKKMKEGHTPNCIAAELLENCKSEEEHRTILEVAGTGFAAGADTTTSSLGSFFYAMAMFPEIQAKAQEEIDLIVGPERLVNFGDQSSLPYIEALRREVLRWRPVLPLGVTRAATSDDVYEGYYIPKGMRNCCAIVVYNVWALAHDSTKYHNPDTFNPDRFFKDGNLNNDNVNFVFGFGRRMCPGRHFAIDTIWLSIATVLQNFTLRKKRDSTGQEIPISGKYGGEMLRHLLPFECSITPRSTEAKHIILDAVKHA